MQLGVGAIGGKDSMSGSFENLDVPPTLVSFAVTTDKVENIVSNEFKAAGHSVILLEPEYDENGLPMAGSLKELYSKVTQLLREGKALACSTPERGGVAAAIMKMCFGNGFGFAFDAHCSVQELFEERAGRFVLEVLQPVDGAKLLGEITDKAAFTLSSECLAAKEVLDAYCQRLESVYPVYAPAPEGKVETFSYQAQKRVKPAAHIARPRVLIPVFPGTNCEYDSAKAVRDAGAVPVIQVLNNLSSAGIAQSAERFAKALDNAQAVFIPGGFSGGDEPDGSGKFITAFFRNAAVKEGVTRLLEQRDGLMCGICNGFQALIKLGLVPYGRIIDADENSPTLTFNTIARHQSRIVRTRVCSNKSPWLSLAQVGDIAMVPISHGEGRFVAPEKTILELAQNGQIATQYVDFDGQASLDIAHILNGSMYAVEGITSPDGRVLGKMGHSERIGEGLYKNVPGSYDIMLFKAAVEYFA